MNEDQTQAQAATPARKKPWLAWTISAAVLLVILVLAYLILAAVLPVWWANTIGAQVNGDLGAGILVGMFYGFTFTLVPLLVAWQARYRRISWPWKIGIIVAAILLATPNLLTAGIAFGTSGSAHQAQRILGTEATWFIPWTLYSAIAAALVFIAIVALWSMWRRRGRSLKALRTAEKERAEAAGQGRQEQPDGRDNGQQPRERKDRQG